MDVLWYTDRLLLVGQTQEDAMPLYEYKCKSCGEKEERLEKFETPTEHDCLFCHTAMGMHRQLSLTSFMLAGNSWMAHGYECNKGKSNNKETSTTSATSSPAVNTCTSSTVKQTTKSDSSSNK